jgi:hypothetical protein
VSSFYGATPPSGPAVSYKKEGYAPGGRTGMVVGIIIALIVVGILGAGAALFTKVWDPMWNPFRPAPEKVIANMALKMASVKTLHSDISANLNWKDGAEYDIKTSVSADADSTDIQNSKTGGRFSANLTMAGDQSLLAFELKQIGQSIYVELTTVPSASTVSQLSSIPGGNYLNLPKDQWIKIDSGGLEKTSASPEKLEELLINENLYQIKTELPDERMGNVMTYHYEVSLDSQAFRNAIIVPDQLKDMVQPAIDNFFAGTGDLTGELWIGKKDNFLYGFKMQKSFDLSQTTAALSVQGSVSLNADFSQFNESMMIEAPVQFQTLEEANLAIQKMQLQQKDEKIMSDMAGLTTIAESIREKYNSYEFLCVDRTSLLNKTEGTYGQEISDFENDIRQLQSGILYCFDSAASYCIVSDMASSDRGRWCVDSAGAAKEIPATKGCAGNGTATYPWHCP